MRYKNKVFVITGASGGIGAALARQIAGRRHKLVLASRGAERLERIAAECRALGAHAIAVPTDVAVDTDCRQLIERAIEAFGGIDVLINGAGASSHARFDAVADFASYERLWRVNCLGAIQCTRHAYPHLRAAPGKRGGQVVGISSLAGKVGVPGGTAFCASRFAQSGFFEALRTEAEDDGIAVTVAYPAAVKVGSRRAVPHGLGDDTAMTADQCARLIMRAIRARKRELVTGRTGRIRLWLKLIAPRWIERMARAGVEKNTEEIDDRTRFPAEP
ncbi:MAG: SDR family oxidoreductase [Gemmatimonadota bacterium]